MALFTARDEWYSLMLQKKHELVRILREKDETLETEKQKRGKLEEEFSLNRKEFQQMSLQPGFLVSSRGACVSDLHWLPMIHKSHRPSAS